MKRNSESSRRAFFISLLLVCLLIFLDLFTKNVAMRVLPDHQLSLIPGTLTLVYLENEGAAFGILGGKTIALSAVSAVCILFLVRALLSIPASRRMLPLRLSLISLTAGAFGNLYDRLRFGTVRDFIYVELIRFPVFNLADCFITVSIFTMIILLFFHYEDEDLEFLTFGRPHH